VSGRLQFSAVAACFIALLSGCTPGPASAVDPTSDPEPFAAQTLSGEGTAEGTVAVPLEIPTKARSATIDFGCTGRDRFFSVELGDTMAHGGAPLVGLCDGVRRLAVAVDPSNPPALNVMVPEGVRWVATVTFSPEEFHGDPAVTTDCADYSQVFSTLSNADIGYSHYDAVDEPTWRARVAESATSLTDAGSRSETLLAPLFADFGTALTDPSLVVGDALARTQDIGYLIARICDANQSPIIVTGEYGG